VRRRDSSGRLRFTDAEWLLSDGRVVVLEVDGGFHMDAQHWSQDVERERALVATGAIVLRCTSIQLREARWRVARDLRRVGVGESSA
jgi:very-short-patch-repair endonuclease